MLVLLTILLLVAIWGIIKPFKGFSRKQFALAAAAIFVVCLLITPADNKSDTAVAENKPATSPQATTTKSDTALENVSTSEKVESPKRLDERTLPLPRLTP